MTLVGACLKLSSCADNAILQVAAIMHDDAAHEHAVDDLHVAAQLAHCAQDAALDAAPVPAVRHQLLRMGNT